MSDIWRFIISDFLSFFVALLITIRYFKKNIVGKLLMDDGNADGTHVLFQIDVTPSEMVKRRYAIYEVVPHADLSDKDFRFVDRDKS